MIELYNDETISLVLATNILSEKMGLIFTWAL